MSHNMYGSHSEVIQANNRFVKLNRYGDGLNFTVYLNLSLTINRVYEKTCLEKDISNMDTIRKIFGLTEIKEKPKNLHLNAKNFGQDHDDDFDMITKFVNDTNECYKKGICEDISHYPENLIEKQIKKNPHFKLLQLSDELEPPREMPPDIIQKSGFDSIDIQPLCKSRIKLMRPKAMKDEINSWYIIPNDVNFMQMIEVETCITEDSSCDYLEGFPENYQTICQQKYVHTKLVALGYNKKLETRVFRIPAGCYCGGLY